MIEQMFRHENIYESLPIVNFKTSIYPNNSDKLILTKNIVYDNNNFQIGLLNVDYHLIDDKKNPNNKRILFSSISGIYINESFRNLGYGIATYKKIIDINNDVPIYTSTKHLNNKSLKIWQFLIKNGLAKEVINTESNLIGFISSINENHKKNISENEIREIINVYNICLPL